MALSGQKTVTAAGTAEALGTRRIGGPMLVKALLANTQNVYVGNNGSGDVSSSNGYPLDAGQEVRLEYVADLSEVLVDADTNGEGVAWIAL